MLESNFRFHRKYSYNHKKSKEEQEKEIAGLPKHIGPYEIIEKIKDGGYSKIYKAKSCYTGDFVALKTIDKQSFQESVEDVLLMIRQTEVLKILKHRNLVSLYEIYESTKYFYLVMDYLPNGDLIERIIKQKRFKEEEALNIFAQLVDALYYMHQNEICHRDIRTEKILFDKNNKPKLVGFSYSSFYTKGKKNRDNYGSLCYACPEIIQNDFYNPELADVWSLGVVLYVMICGYLPFSEDDDEKNKQLIINGEVEYPPEISNKVKDLLRHMLDIDPNKRYNFLRIIRHPWFKPFSELTLFGGVNIYKMIYPVDERILKIIVIYGFNKKEIDMDLKQNKFNEGTGLYKHLTDKFLNMGFISYSDLCSKDYLEFKKDESNIISDGDKKYKKYINKILDKIKKVERYVNDYKRKEDKVIRDLESIYADAQAEEMKRIQKEKEKELMNNNNRNRINRNYKNMKSQKYDGQDININNLINDPKNFQRRTLSPMLTVKEQKGIKDILASKIGYVKKANKKNNIQTINNRNQNDDDFDVLKNFQENKIINEDSSIFIFDGNDDEINDKILKKCPSNPNIKEFVKKLLEKEENNNNSLFSTKNVNGSNIDEDEYRPAKRKRQLSVMIKKKKRSYLNTSSVNDSFLRKPKNEKQRKKIIKDHLIQSINQVIIEENINEGNPEQNNDDNNKMNNNKNIKSDIDNHIVNNNKNINIGIINNNINSNDSTHYNREISRINTIKEDEIDIKKVETKKSKKNLRYSLSFGDDEDEDVEESGFISKIDSKQVSMYDIDEELKELKEIRNTLKSPVCGPFLKKNTNDNKLFNFNIDNNSTIFGEHLDDNNVTNNTNATQLANINERYDILTQLKKLYEKNSTEVAKSKYEGDSKIVENNQFKDDSFGDSKNYKYNYNPIVFDDRLEISFHDENNRKSNVKNVNNSNNNNSINNINNSINNNTNSNFGFNNNTNHNSIVNNNNISSNSNNREELITYINDKKYIKKMNNLNKLEEFILSVSYIDLKKQNKYNYKYLNDLNLNKRIKIDITNDNLNINNIELKRRKKCKNKNQDNKQIGSPIRKISNSLKKKSINKELIQKNTNEGKIRIKNFNKNKKNLKNKEESLKKSINSSVENLNNISNSMNTNSINDVQTLLLNSNMNTIDKTDIINPLINSQDNMSNDYNNDLEKQKIYIIDNIDILDNSCNETIKNEDCKNHNNNIIINSNNNTINNISINNKNNYGNYYEQGQVTNNNYYINEKNKKNNHKRTLSNKLDWSKITNTVQKETKKPVNYLGIFTEREKTMNKNNSKNKKELILMNTERKMPEKKTKQKSSSIISNKSLNNNRNKANNKLYKYNKNDIKSSLFSPDKKAKLQISLKKGLHSKNNSNEHKKKNNFFSIEKTLHSNLMSNDFENPEDAKEFISKVKQGQKIYQLVVNDKKNYLNKFINVKDKKNNINHYKDKKEKTNYVQQYHKKLNSSNNNNINYLNYSNRKDVENNLEMSGYPKKSDLIDYNYLFSIYNKMNNNIDDDISSLTISHRKVNPRHQSIDNNYLQTTVRKDDITFGKNDDLDD